MKKLAKARRKAGLTQKGLADAISCSPFSVAKWEQGTRKPTLKMIPVLCKVLKCSPNEIIDMEE